MKNYIILLLVIFTGCISQAAKIDDCYANNHNLKDATYCADYEIAKYTQTLHARITELEKIGPKICIIEQWVGHYAKLFVGGSLVKTFYEQHYKTWSELMVDANAAGKKLESAGLCTFI